MGKLKKLVIGNWQRARRGYSDEDLFNFDIYIADLIARGLSDFTHRTQNRNDWGGAVVPLETSEIIRGLRIYVERDTPFAKDRGRKAIRQLADVFHKYFE